MNPVENIEKLIESYFNQKVLIQNKNVNNNCIGALVDEGNFIEFRKNFEERLQRLSNRVSDVSQRTEIVKKIKNLAEKTGYKWSGAYSELVALDFFLCSDYIMNTQFINKFEASKYPNSLAAKNNKKIIDVDFSFELGVNTYFTDIKSLIYTQKEILDSIIDNVLKRFKDKKILIEVDNLQPESILDFQVVIDNERKEIEEELYNGINKSKTCIIYKTAKGFEYTFRVSYNGMLLTMQSKNPYELAKLDKYKYLNYYNKLLDKDYSFITFVVNPWFNQEINDFCDYNELYYRSVTRRVFCELNKDITPAGIYFKDIKNYSITISDISKNIAGILFIEDKSVKKDLDGLLYKSYLYLNPNYINKQALTVYDFASAFEGSTISKMMRIEDFQDDNY